MHHRGSIALCGMDSNSGSEDLEFEDWEDDWQGGSQPSSEDRLYSLVEQQQDFGLSGQETLLGQGAEAWFDTGSVPQNSFEEMSSVQGQKWANISLNETWTFPVAQVPGTAADFVNLFKTNSEINDEVLASFHNGHSLWPGCIVLSRWLAISPPPEELSGKTVVEIGGGLGLPGVTAALLGAQNVVVQDCDMRPLQMAMETAVENGIAGQVTILRCQWQDLPEKLLTFQGGSIAAADVVLGAEVLYNEAGAGEIADVLDRLLQHSGQVAYILDNYKGEHQAFFKKRCVGHGLDLKEAEIVTWEPELEDSGNTDEWTCILMTIRRV
eukprot:CAMPEP_0172694566 /NCGR_PEP_ID=MMETSP1074-20121228/26753_1 /TAXON_ID=2916 /ORGANISM="Ceratium fusus, Strain PA161109" /LENGTH=324 /DNA_ID=CAMNT_0013515075 /DNA_START=234 /DNA_END=1208 /DNA_ORIENTATION=-